MHKLALLCSCLLAAASADGLADLVEDLRQEAREEFETVKGIDASELDGYVDAFVADGLARITRRVAMEIDDDGEAQAQFEWVRRETRPPTLVPLPCPATHRCGAHERHWIRTVKRAASAIPTALTARSGGDSLMPIIF